LITRNQEPKQPGLGNPKTKAIGNQTRDPSKQHSGIKTAANNLKPGIQASNLQESKAATNNQKSGNQNGNNQSAIRKAAMRNQTRNPNNQQPGIKSSNNQKSKAIGNNQNNQQSTQIQTIRNQETPNQESRNK
jgi:hypothetical protein